MDKVVKLVKYFMKVCNRKDWSHLTDMREDMWGEEWSGRSEDWNEWRMKHSMSGVVSRNNGEKDLPDEDLSEPVDIHNFIPKNKIPCQKVQTKVRIMDDDVSDEEFSSTEENSEVTHQRRRRRLKKILRKPQRTDQLIFVL